MKNLLIAIIAVFTLGTFSTNAQNATFAHVHSNEVLDSIQSYKNLVKEEQMINEDANKMYEKLQQKMVELQPTEAEYAELSDFEIEMISTDIQKVQMDMQKLEQNTQKNLNVLQERLMMLMEKYREAVKIVAERHSITYVLDADAQTLYASPKGKDLTDEVRKELIKMDTENPVHTLGN